MSSTLEPISSASMAPVLRRLLNIENRYFSGRNLRVYGLALATANGITLAWFFLSGLWPIISRARPGSCVDFGWMWISGKFALSDNPGRIYDYAAFAKSQADLFGAGNCILLPPFDYPPTLLFFTYPLGLMPFVVAFVLWDFTLLLFFLAAVYGVVRHSNALIGALTMRPVEVNLYVGHNGFLTAGLAGVSLTLLERRPILSGALLGLLTYKPQFGLLFPIALVASRNWRALFSATVFSVALALAAILAFGAHAWFSFLSSLLNRGANLSPNAAVQIPLMSIYGILQSAGVEARTAWAVHGVATLILAGAVWAAWSNPLPYPIRASLLCIASLVASPYALSYDFTALGIAFAFFISDGLTRGFLAGERTAMVVCGTVLLSAGIRSGPIIVCGILLWLLYRRIAVLGAKEWDARITIKELPE